MKNIVNFVPARSFMTLIVETISLMNQDSARHQLQVGYLSYQLAQEMELPPGAAFMIMQAGLMHDIGGSIQGENFTVKANESEAEKTARIGADLLDDFPGLKAIAEAIRYSQRKYLTSSDKVLKLSRQPVPSQIIHLADAVTMLLDKDEPVLNQPRRIFARLDPYVGTVYSPRVFEALKQLEDDDRVWLNLMYQPYNLAEEAIEDRYASLSEMMIITKFVATLIDFRSPFTAMHSAGVAAAAATLARLAGFSEVECTKMEIAGNLHDLGKLRTPTKILEKPDKLTPEEYNIIKEHAYFTYETLKRIPGLDEIAEWAGYHHEKINGKGYPYGLKGNELPQGSKMMAVADIFAAITEDRPYSKARTKAEILGILNDYVKEGALSHDMVALLTHHYEEVDKARFEASRKAGKHYYRSVKLDDLNNRSYAKHWLESLFKGV